MFFLVTGLESFLYYIPTERTENIIVVEAGQDEYVCSDGLVSSDTV